MVIRSPGFHGGHSASVKAEKLKRREAEMGRSKAAPAFLRLCTDH